MDGSPTVLSELWVGGAVVAGYWGCWLARARAEARLTSDGGAAATRGGDEDGTVEPASKHPRDHVNDVRTSKGS